MATAARRVYDEFEDDGLLWLLWLLGVALLCACAALRAVLRMEFGEEYWLSRKVAAAAAAELCPARRPVPLDAVLAVLAGPSHLEKNSFTARRAALAAGGREGAIGGHAAALRAERAAVSHRAIQPVADEEEPREIAARRTMDERAILPSTTTAPSPPTSSRGTNSASGSASRAAFELRVRASTAR